MTTIGFATLQIIPSLKGVSEAIEKEVAGKSVRVTVDPQVDTRSAQKAGRQAGETITKEAKAAVRKGDIGKTVGDEIASSAKKSNGPKEAAKVFIDGIADGVKKELPKTGAGGIGRILVDGIADGVKQGIDGEGIGGQVVDTIGKGVKSGNLGGTIKDAVVPAIKNIGDEIRTSAASWSGDIGNALRSGDIKGATDEIGNTVRGTTDLISDIGETFGLQLDGVRNFGNEASTILSDFGTDIQNGINTANGIKDTLNGVGTILETVLPGKAGTGAAGIARALASVAVPAWLLYLVAQERSKMTWGNGDPVSAIPGPSDFTPGKRSTAEILLGPFLGPAIDRAVPGGGSGPAPVPAGVEFNRRFSIGSSYGVGGYTGNGSRNGVAGVVHGGEYVINARATAGIDKAMPGLLGYLNSLPGYKGGGKVSGITTGEQQSMWDAVRANFPSATLNSATRTNMTEGRPDFHNAGRAIDIGGPNMGSIAAWIASNYPDSLELIHSPFGHNIKNGRNVGDGMGWYGARLMAQHRDHVHWALGRTASAVRSSADQAMSGNDMLAALGNQPTASAESVSPATTSGSMSSGASSSMQLSSSISGLAGTGWDTLGPTTQVSPDSPVRTFEIGKAGAAAVSGQLSSAFGMLGVNDSPGWLRAAAGLINGTTISDKKSGDSIVPAAASSSLMGAAGSALNSLQTGTSTTPASVTNFNIQTTDLEPAYLISQRQSKERAAAEMSRY